MIVTDRNCAHMEECINAVISLLFFARTSKQVQNLSKFANKNKSIGIFYQYYKYEYYND